MFGRVFSTDEEQPGKDKVAVISHGLWQRRFGSNTNILGQFITINHERHAIVGVMRPGFNFPRGAEMPAGYALMAQTDVWFPYAENAEYWRNDDQRDFIAMGRLKSGVTVAQAQAEMIGIAQREAETYPKSHTGWTIRLRPVALQVAGKTRPVLLILLGAVAFVLLIACANVANLLLCRSAARRKEMAVRAALGAGRGRIIRQLLTESMLVAVASGVLGFLMAMGLMHLASQEKLPYPMPLSLQLAPDGRVLLFTLGLTAFTGMAFGLIPAWRATRTDLTPALKEGGNPDFTIKEFPNLNHLFQTCKTGAVSEYAMIEETLAPVVLETIAKWIAKRTIEK
jgi:putative ABC transport system permease protein